MSSQNLAEIPVIESEDQPEGTYTCVDKNGNPIPQKDIGKVEVSKIIVRDIETFKIAIKHKQESNE